MKTTMTALILAMTLTSITNSQAAVPQAAKHKAAPAIVAPNPELTDDLAKSSEGAMLKNSESGELLTFVRGKANPTRQRQQQRQRQGGVSVNVGGKLSDVTEDENLVYGLVSMNSRNSVKEFSEIRDLSDLNDVIFLVNTELTENTASAKIIMKKFNLKPLQYAKVFKDISSLASGRPGSIITISAREYNVITSVVPLMLNDEDKSIADLYTDVDAE